MYFFLFSRILKNKAFFLFLDSLCFAKLYNNKLECNIVRRKFSSYLKIKSYLAEIKQYINFCGYKSTRKKIDV